MPWPTPQDYYEAIQNPKLCFEDAELKAGEPERDALGLPRPITGGFASVYQIRCGQRNWAVRCFLREFPDQQQRYLAISNHLATVKLPYIVGFKFISRGIKVRDQWYPILKMEWVQGDLLHEYIKKHLQDPKALFNLAERWQAMAKSLHRANIGHGDLQHGNVLVVNGDFRLIDYDAMFVPVLARQISHEVGHRNYQHPSRTEFDFGSYLDYFSTWVIYVSLVALSIDHKLWHSVGAGDESILFRKEDFVEPDSSATFRLLTKHADTRIQSLTAFFGSFLYLSPSQVPPLDDQPALPISSTTHPSIDWLADYVKPAHRSTAPSSGSNESTNIPLVTEGSAWVLDIISSAETVSLRSFNSSVSIPRTIALTSIYSLIVVFTIWYLTTALSILYILFLVIATGFINRGVFLYYYHKDPIVLEREILITHVGRESRFSDSQKRGIKDQQTEKKNLLTEEEKKRATLTKQMSDLQDRERTEKSVADAQLTQIVNSINIRRLGLNRDEVDALRRIQEALGYELTRLNRQISSLTQAESDETQRTLQTKQNKFLKDYLSQHEIKDASISGVGDKLKARLRASGIFTAADIEYGSVNSVEGIGSNKSNALVRWRDSIATQARTHMPNSLNQFEFIGIRQKYESQKRQLESQRGSVQQRLAAEESAIRDQYASKRNASDAEQSAAQNKSLQELQSITNKYAKEYASISQKLAQLATEAQTESKKIEEDISKLQKQMFDCHWRLAKARHELKPFENLSFRAYIRFVFLGH